MGCEGKRYGGRDVRVAGQHIGVVLELVASYRAVA